RGRASDRLVRGRRGQAGDGEAAVEGALTVDPAALRDGARGDRHRFAVDVRSREGIDGELPGAGLLPYRRMGGAAPGTADLADGADAVGIGRAADVAVAVRRWGAAGGAAALPRAAGCDRRVRALHVTFRGRPGHHVFGADVRVRAGGRAIQIAGFV